ncbi:hypothetical protein GA0070613_2081 [Micromonospora inositola]|uniref:Uncharacterized protein n=1 Tax=Micromonospora inositola TaxID=47865 RepID=A0A1C5I0E5_9ACTN|nr:hypothetical protein GA0070613_2081 [Micromonospora inositola]
MSNLVRRHLGEPLRDGGASLLFRDLLIPNENGLIGGESVHDPLPGAGRLSLDQVLRAPEDHTPEVREQAHDWIVSASINL